MLKKLMKIKIAVIVVCVGGLFALILTVICAIAGVSMGEEAVNRQVTEMRSTQTVINNQLYAERYRAILNKYLNDKGYVTLERLVFYLQRTNNVLDITTLSNEKWEEAYLHNLNDDYKQMVPIKTICEEIKKDTSLPTFTIENGTNSEGIAIDVIDLCTVNGEDITLSDEYSESYPYLPYKFPLKANYTVTSMVFENRDVDLNLSEEELASVNYHSGWDFAVPIGTPFYSVCNGTIKRVVTTQYNDLPYNTSLNSTGNYVIVTCDNGFDVSYHHIQANSVPFLYTRVGALVKIGDLLGRTSTTGRSTGPHLHLGLNSSTGTRLDALEYIDFSNKE